MSKTRFGLAGKQRPCTCHNCKKPIAIGIDRYFDNTTFPKAPICVPCKLQVEAESPLKIEIRQLIHDALVEITPDLKKLITEAVIDAIAPAYIVNTNLVDKKTTVKPARRSKGKESSCVRPAGDYNGQEFI